MRHHYGNFYSHRVWCGSNVMIATIYADFNGLRYDFFSRSELVWPVYFGCMLIYLWSWDVAVEVEDEE